MINIVHPLTQTVHLCSIYIHLNRIFRIARRRDMNLAYFHLIPSVGKHFSHNRKTHTHSDIFHSHSFTRQLHQLSQLGPKIPSPKPGWELQWNWLISGSVFLTALNCPTQICSCTGNPLNSCVMWKSCYCITASHVWSCLREELRRVHTSTSSALREVRYDSPREC